MALRIAAAFAIGLAGALLASGWGLPFPVVLGGAGFFAGLIAREGVALLAHLAGIAAAYPAALHLGIFVLLGEEWYVALAIGGAVAGFGYVLGSVTADARDQLA